LLLKLEHKRLDSLEFEPKRHDFFVPHVVKRNNAKKAETTQDAKPSREVVMQNPANQRSNDLD